MIDRKPDSTRDGKLADFWPEVVNEAYVWCLHCLRVFSVAEWDRTQCCPAADCDGSPRDARAWSDLAKLYGWPAVPVEGQVYDPYPDL